MKRNLIVARAGSKSLHPHWLTGAGPDFDLVVTYYGEEIPEEWIDQGYPIVRIKGPKWRGLYEYFAANEHWKAYDSILLPDDDLMFDAALINRFFALVGQFESDLSQPALDRQSYFSHPVTLASKSFQCRVTNFVEIMCPCMSPRLLELALPVFTESASGWGMEFHWARLLAESTMKLPMIFDGTPITHTRPVGVANSGTDAEVNPANEMQAFLSKHGLVYEIGVTLAGVLTSGELIDGVKSRDRLAPYLVRDAIANGEQLGAPRLAWFIDTIMANVATVCTWLENRKTTAALSSTVGIAAQSEPPWVSGGGAGRPPFAGLQKRTEVLTMRWSEVDAAGVVPVADGDMHGVISLIRGASLRELRDARFLERELLLQAGLNNEILREFPSELYPFCGQGIRSWQYPMQFSRYLVFLSERNLRSYVEIGCRFGGTFIICVEYLRRFSDLALACAFDIEPSELMTRYARTTVGVEYRIESSTSPDTIAYLGSHPWSLALIDGDHSYDGCRRDYISVRHRASLIALHDVVSDVCPGVCQMWTEIKAIVPRSRIFEAVDQYREVREKTNSNFLGIGVVDFS